MRVYRHQKEAIRWMLQREQQADAHNILGGILGDDMGLGKTVTVLGLYKKKPCRTLIVCPVSVVHQWVRECEKHLHFSPTVVSENSISENSRSRIEIVTHSTVSRGRFSGVFWYDRVVVDEAHRMKSRSSALFRNACLIPSTFRWCISGTPVVTTKIPPRSVASEEPKSGDIGSLALFLSQNQCKVSEVVLSDIMMRRQKEEVFCDLAPVAEHTSVLNLNSAEQMEYDALYSQGKRCVLQYCESQYLLCLITQMRQICALAEAKFEHLGDCLHYSISGARILIFCHYLSEIERAVQVCQQHLDVTMQYHGKVGNEERKKIVETFMTPGTQRMGLVLQINSGGEGLNLQAATSVHIMSPSWSAASDSQAVSRAHRLNTRHTVSVYRYLMSGTVEEFIYTRQRDKKKTAEVLLGDSEKKEERNGGQTPGYWDEALKLFE